MSLSEELANILKKANAGLNFDDNGETLPRETNNSINPVKPEKNQSNQKYLEVRTDPIDSVLENGKKIDFTNVFNNYIRLLMPQYARRVEVEDLDRNFWVIGQVLSLLVKHFVNGLGTRMGVVVLPNSKDYDDVKYDNFDIIEDGYIVNSTINWNNREEQEKWEELIFDRLSYLKDIYSNDDLLILPVIRYNNYYQNYYRKELYLGLYEFTKDSEEEQFHWFYNEDGQVQPIISEITGDKDVLLFHLNDDQEDLRFYWYFGYKDSDQGSSTHQKAYIAALRGVPTFIDSNSLTIRIEDAIGKALSNVHQKTYYQENYTINKVNGRYQWEKTITKSDCAMGTSGDTSFTSATGFYLGELTSDRSIFEGISDYNLEIHNYNLRPISPSLFQMRYMLDHPGALNGSGSDVSKRIRGETPSDGNFKFLPLIPEFQPVSYTIPFNFYNVLGCATDEAGNNQIVKYGKGKTGNKYDTYNHQEDGRLVLTQHGEDRAILDLMTDKLVNEIDRTNRKVKLHLFSHALLLQKAEGGTVQSKSDELKNVYTATLKDGTPVLQIAKSDIVPGDSNPKNSYLVYEYDGYLTGTSGNTGGYQENIPSTHFRGSFGPTVLTDIDHATPRRDKTTGSYFINSNVSPHVNWTYKGTPFEMIVIDNGAMAANPSEFDDHETKDKPRFSNGLERYIYGAILEIPWSSSENRCYPFEYSLFENALQDSYGFWRGEFYVNKIDGKYSIGSESYGRWHKIYTNAQYFQNNSNNTEMIIKITNVGITFGPQLKTHYTGENFAKPTADNTVFITNLPNEYTDGTCSVTEETNHFINYQKNQPYSYYFNEFGTPKHISPFAPLYAYGWPVRSTAQQASVWEEEDAQHFTIVPAITPQEEFSLNLAMVKYLKGDINTLDTDYLPLIMKGNSYSKRGYGGSILPVQMHVGSELYEFSCSELENKLAYARTVTEYPYKIDLFSKQLGDQTLNEGRFLDNTQYKFYGFTTLVHTVYVKIDLKQSNDCQYSISNLKRIDVDYKPIISNHELRWKKEWTPGITDSNNTPLNQTQIESLLSTDYILKQSVGDFVSTESSLPNRVVFDFSKYPSNGMCSIQNIDPTPETIFNTIEGVLTPTTTPQIDMNILATVPVDSETYPGESVTINTYQENLVLEGNTIVSGTSNAIQESGTYHNYIILKYTMKDATTGVEIETDYYKFEIPGSNWDRTFTITASHSGYNTITKTITVGDDFNIEGPLIPPEENPNTPPEENPE